MPTGSNEWSVAVQCDITSAVLRRRMSRDIDYLKGNFEKMANAKKATGDLSCTEDFCREKTS